MGDIRFQHLYERVKEAPDRASLLKAMREEDIIAALAGASRAADPLLANVLATEAQNRVVRNRAMLENLGEGLIAETPLGYVRYMNEEAERLLGWPRDELVGQDFHKVCHIADQQDPEARCPILGAAATGKVMHLHKEMFRTRDGRRFWSSVTVAPLWNGAGEVDGLICVFHDTTREREQGADVERARHLMAAVVRAQDDLGQGSLVVERDEVVHANAAFRRMSGYSLEELRAMPDYLDLFHATFLRDALRRLLQEDAGAAVPAFDEGALLRKDGTQAPVEVAIVKVAPEEDDFLIDVAVPRLVVLVRDVSARREAEESLRRVVETLPEGVYVTDAAGRITYANAGAERILGLERSRLAGRTYRDPVWDACTHEGVALSESAHPAARALHEGETVHDAPLSILRARHGERVRLRVSAAPLRDEAGRIVGSVVSFNETRASGH